MVLLWICLWGFLMGLCLMEIWGFCKCVGEWWILGCELVDYDEGRLLGGYFMR